MASQWIHGGFTVESGGITVAQWGHDRGQVAIQKWSGRGSQVLIHCWGVCCQKFVGSHRARGFDVFEATTQLGAR